MRRGLNEMIDRFLKYSLENEKKICAVLMMDGAEVDALTAEFENMYQKMEIPDTGDAAQP